MSWLADLPVGLRLPSTLVLFAALLGALGGCTTVTRDDPVIVGPVHLRAGGEHTSREPLSDAEAKVYAEALLPFARVASRAYCDYLRAEGAQPEECDSASPMVSDDGWQLLFDSRDVLAVKDQQSRLTFLAFYRVHANDPTTGDIVFGFRGTKFTYASDWNANFRWITRLLPGSDQYDILYSYVPRMISKAQMEASNRAPLVNRFSIYSTGHSLGGGLAQLFAYSDRRVRAAVVFDPSPVTGYRNVVTDDRVNCDARVLRVYERGEILQYVRAVMRRLYAPTSNVVEVDFNLLHEGFNPVANHSIKGFTDKLAKAVTVLNERSQSGLLDRRERRIALEERLPKDPDNVCIADRMDKARDGLGA